MFIMKYVNGGNLYNYLQGNFTKITWKKKLYILWRISDGYLLFSIDISFIIFIKLTNFLFQTSNYS
jgi:hypothetical protein